MLERMTSYAKAFHSATGVAGDTMQRRIALYWASLILVVFAAFFSVVAILGFFSAGEQKLCESMMSHHKSVVLSIEEQVDMLSAHSLVLSSKASLAIEQELRGDSVQSLSDNPSRLESLELSLCTMLSNSLLTGPCNGTFAVIDATVNTSAPEADSSRAGLYIRYANLNSNTAIGQDLVCYRGMADVARESDLELHNRWKPEFDTDLIEGYGRFLEGSNDVNALRFEWTDRVNLTDTWENAIMVVAPIVGSDGSTYGICGLELSDLYMRLSYPVFESEFGNIVTVIAPLRDDVLDVSKGITGELSGTYLSDDDVLYVTNGDRVNAYEGENGSYRGIHTVIDLDLDGHPDSCIATLVSEACYDAAATERSGRLLILSLVLLVLSLALALAMSRKCAQPVSDAISAIRAGSLSDVAPTGVSEIDALVSFLDGRENNQTKDLVAPEVLELLDDFAGLFGALTATERTIAKLYGDGYEVHDVADMLFISIHTVRKHNANIYRKLGIGSREELTLYIEIFRRSDRLGDLFGGEEES